MSSGGGSGSSGVDEAYNARMATIAEEQQAMANEYYQYWKSGPGHWETETVTTPGTTSVSGGLSAPSASGDILDFGSSAIGEGGSDSRHSSSASSSGLSSIITPATTTTTKKWVSDPGGVSYQQMEQAQMKANMELIPKQTGLQSAQIDEAMTNINLRKPVTSKYYDQVMNGVNVDERVNFARADVADAYSGAEANARRWASSMGINPASKKYGSGLMSLAKEKASATVGATSLARRQAEEESFARLSGAMGLSAA